MYNPAQNSSKKWIKDLSIKPDTLNLKEEKVGENLESISTGDHFQNKASVSADMFIPTTLPKCLPVGDVSPSILSMRL